MGDIFPRRGRTLFLRKQSGYGKIVVREVIENNKLLRLLTVDEVRESAAYMEEGRHFELVFKYTKDFLIPLEKRPDIKDTLLLGGAGFSFPKYYISHYPGKRIDVVEINKLMYELAMKYFYLDELYEKYGLAADNRMDVFIMDATRYLESSDRKYDLIINDAYIGRKIDDDLVKERQVRLIKEHLSPGGVYVINMITSLTGTAAMPGLFEYEIMKKNFKYADIFACKDEAKPHERQNCILIGSDGEVYR